MASIDFVPLRVRGVSSTITERVSKAIAIA